MILLKIFKSLLNISQRKKEPISTGQVNDISSSPQILGEDDFDVENSKLDYIIPPPYDDSMVMRPSPGVVEALEAIEDLSYLEMHTLSITQNDISH